MKELKSISAIKSEKRFDKATGEQTSNLYTVYRSQGVIYDLPSVKSDPSPSASETYKLESSNHSHSLEDRKALWSALTDSLGYTPKTQTERAGWNKCIKQLREAGAKADDIPNRVKQYKKHFKGMTLTPYALVKHWSLLDSYVQEEPKKHDCAVEGHGMIDLDVIEKCRFCGLEISKQTTNS